MTSSSSTDLDDVGRLLAALVHDRGGDLLHNRRRLLGLLRDKAPDARRAVGMMMTAFDHGVPARLRRGSDSGETIAKETEILTERAGISRALAQDVVSAWANAVASHTATGDETSRQADPDVPAAEEAASSLPAIERPVSQPTPPPPPRSLPEIQPLPAMTPAAAVAPAPTPVPAIPATKDARGSRGRKLRWLAGSALVLALGGSIALLYAVGVLPLSFPTRSETVSSPPPSAPSAAPAPKPVVKHAANTPEGFKIVSDDMPIPDIQTKRMRGDPNSLVVDFGIFTHGETISYEAGVAFKRGQREGMGYVKAFKGGRIASTGFIKIERKDLDDTTMTIEASGVLTNNTISAPDLCVTLYLQPKSFARLNVGDGSFLAAEGRYASGVCGGTERYGSGNLR